jgi:hypothetical protein
LTVVFLQPPLELAGVDEREKWPPVLGVPFLVSHPQRYSTDASISHHAR